MKDWDRAATEQTSRNIGKRSARGGGAARPMQRVEPDGERVAGKVKRLVLDRGFGFIASGETDYFFHRSECQGVEFENLEEGDAVHFTSENSPKGPRAVSIERPPA